jgi:hypothetical protein
MNTRQIAVIVDELIQLEVVEEHLLKRMKVIYDRKNKTLQNIETTQNEILKEFENAVSIYEIYYRPQ